MAVEGNGVFDAGAAAIGRPLRIGVCGSGHWAKTVHLPALAAMPEIELVGVWGRSAEQSRALADRFDVKAFAAFDLLLSEVDAVSFAVPPEIQAVMALAAANAGKHLLLEKPVATTLAEADRLVEIVERERLSAVVFLTRLFANGSNDLIARARAAGHTRCEAGWSSKALLPGTAFTNSVWRNGDYGTLWDLGPHVLSMFMSVLGPVTRIEASRVRKAKFVFRAFHAGGAESSAMLDQMDESLPLGSREHYVFSGGEAVTEGGPFTYQSVDCYTAAVRLLIDGIRATGGASGPSIRLGRDIVAVLEAACFSIESGGAAVDVHL